MLVIVDVYDKPLAAPHSQMHASCKPKCQAGEQESTLPWNKVVCLHKKEVVKTVDLEIADYQNKL